MTLLFKLILRLSSNEATWTSESVVDASPCSCAIDHALACASRSLRPGAYLIVPVTPSDERDRIMDAIVEFAGSAAEEEDADDEARD